MEIYVPFAVTIHIYPRFSKVAQNTFLPNHTPQWVSQCRNAGATAAQCQKLRCKDASHHHHSRMEPHLDSLEPFIGAGRQAASWSRSE